MAQKCRGGCARNVDSEHGARSEERTGSERDKRDNAGCCPRQERGREAEQTLEGGWEARLYRDTRIAGSGDSSLRARANLLGPVE